jgi:pyruvate,water dikinase
MLSMAIDACRKADQYIGICGQGPSDHPVTGAMAGRSADREHVAQSDTVVETWLALAAHKPSMTGAIALRWGRDHPSV